MQYKTIGNTKVPVIGQGTGKVKDENIIKLGIQCGMTFIDTSETYGNEEIIGKAIKGQRDKVFISDKFASEHNGYDGVIKSCENSLKKLGTDYIDLYSMYYPNPDIDLSLTLGALVKLKQEGKIRYIGTCNTPISTLRDWTPDFIQMEYNLFDRSIEEKILPYCESNNILTVAYSPLLDWDLLNPDSMIWLQEISFKYGASVRQVILSWLVSHKSVIVIPRSNKP
jgi:diketogulonate reductase-like aldo/keto reductase